MTGDDGMYGLYDEVATALAKAYGVDADQINPNTLVILIEEMGKERLRMIKQLVRLLESTALLQEALNDSIENTRKIVEGFKKIK